MRRFIVLLVVAVSATGLAYVIRSKVSNEANA
jgi:hypothetical protein